MAFDLFCGCLQLCLAPPLPSGRQFVDGPYVEYEGKLSDDEKAALPASLTAKIRELASTGIDSHLRYVSKAEALELCPGSDLSGMQDGAMVRVVSVAGGWCPCGGTHVSTLKELGEVAVTKVKSKKNTLKVSYVLGPLLG